MVDAGRTHSRLILPTGQPKSADDWSRAELVDPRARPVLEKMDADLWPDNMATAKLTGASLLREFLEHRVAPLREHSLLLWKHGRADAALRSNLEALADEDLATVLHALVEGDMARLEGAPVPLFLRDDWEQVVNSMSAFNRDGPVPAGVPEDLAALATVNVSSGDSSREEEEEEQEEEPDS